MVSTRPTFNISPVMEEAKPVPVRGEVLPLVPLTDPILHQETTQYDFDQDGPLYAEQLYLNLVESMRAHGGMGLSANQVGVPLSVFVVETGGEYPEGFFNPRIVNASDEEIYLEEGCLSFKKGLLVKVKRPKTCRVRYQLLTGETITKDYTGMTARCVLHEYDHLQGITMRDRVSKLTFDMAVKKSLKRTR